MVCYYNMFLLFLWTLFVLVLPIFLPPLPAPPMVLLFVPLVIMMLLIFFALSTSQLPTTTVASEIVLFLGSRRLEEEEKEIMKKRMVDFAQNQLKKRGCFILETTRQLSVCTIQSRVAKCLKETVFCDSVIY
uniref:Uncharacterized protein n=1 Tax=Cucumis melo TaxID=3656 RepID=A0A9I9EFU0_CUCME